VTVTAPATSTAAETEIQQLESQLAALTTQQTSASKTNSASSYDFTVFLTVGTQDADVTALQERLTADGLYTGPISGYYGTLTEAAVEKYQAAHGIDAKGYVGPSTRAALNAGE
jgi:peptidoglycan hydrolase-like protein with peptidoglycan-binding domain